MKAKPAGGWFLITGASLMIISIGLGFLDSVTGITFFGVGVFFLMLGLGIGMRRRVQKTRNIES